MLFPCAKQGYYQSENPCLPPEENAVKIKMYTKNCHKQQSRGVFFYYKHLNIIFKEHINLIINMHILKGDKKPTTFFWH